MLGTKAVAGETVMPRHSDYEDKWLAWMFERVPNSTAPMAHVRNPPRSIFRALQLGLVPEQYRKEAMAIIADLDKKYTRHPKWALPARSLYNDPGWDNVVRALDEDR